MRKNGVRVLCVMICSAALCSCGARKTQITLPFTETPVTPVTEEDTDTAYVSAYVPETTVPETTVPEPLTEESETTAGPAEYESDPAVSSESGAEPVTETEEIITPVFVPAPSPVAVGTEIEQACMPFYDTVVTALYDLTNERFILCGDLYQDVIPASLTKLATALYARQIAGTDEIFKVKNETELVSAGSSKAGIAAGESYRFGNLLYAMLLPSGNDAAYAVAAGCGRRLAGNLSLDGGKAVRVFMDGMNAWLKKLGTKNTFFTSPDGIAEKGHHTCIYDVTLISKAVLNDGFLRKVVSAKSFSFTGPSGEKRAYYNTNQLLRENTGCIGLKTGHTGLAGYCLAAAAERGGTVRIALVFGAGSSEERFEAARALLDYDPSAVTDTGTATGTEEIPETSSWDDTVTVPDTGSDTIPETAPFTDTETEPPAETETSAETETEVETETETAPETETEPASEKQTEPAT